MYPCVILHIKCQNLSSGLISACLRKNKLAQESGISPICREVPHEWIFTEFGL